MGKIILRRFTELRFSIAAMVIALAMLPGVTRAKPVRKLQKVSAHTNTLVHAAALAEKGKWNQAIAICDNLAEANSTQTRPALMLKARCLETADSPEEALACYRRILKEYPRAINAKEIQLQTIRLSALELLQPQGIAELEAFIQKNPNSPLLRQTRWWRVGVAYNQRNWTEAKRLLDDFIGSYPNSPENQSARSIRGECEKKLAKIKEMEKRRAAVIARAAAAPQPRETLTDLKAGQMAMVGGNMSAAIKAFSAVRDAGASPEFESALLFLGRVYEQLGKENEALAAWNLALKNGTNALWLDDSLLAKGKLLLDVKAEETAAAKQFRELIENYPESPLVSEAYARLGLSLLFQGLSKEAEAAILKAKETRKTGPPDPWDPLDRLLNVCAGDASLWPRQDTLRMDAKTARWNRLADLLFAARDYEKARRHYEHVAKNATDREAAARALLQAGRCWKQLRRYDKALDCFERFLTSPYDKSEFADDALLRAGVIYVGPLRQSRKGEELYETILEKHPGGDYAELAELYLCTLSYWDRDWKKALTMHEAFIKRYPRSDNSQFVMMERLPEIHKALASKK